MYRCTECYTEYTDLPEYCDCGNDTFEEVLEQQPEAYEEEYYEPAPRPKPKRKPSPEELEEMRKEDLEKKKSLIAIGVIAFLCVAVLFLPPYKKKKMDVVKQKATKQAVLPSVNSYWDNTVPSAHKKKDPFANLPLLNERFRTMAPDLREYLVDIGGEFDRNWDRKIVTGSGECRVQFTIDKEGNLSSKRIINSSHVDSFDNSVLLALSKVNGFNMPPDDYKGERVHILFKISPNGDSQVVYPMK